MERGSLIGQAIAAASEANARRDIEAPIAKAMANKDNAEAFRIFLNTCKDAGIKFDAIEDATMAFAAFAQTTGKL